MTSPETSIVRMEDYVYERAAVAREYFDLELILNRHGSAEDAELSAAAVEPRSVVFLESYGLETPPRLENEPYTLSRVASYLGLMHIDEGVEYPPYVQIKQMLLKQINEALDEPIEDKDAFSLVLYKSLIEKDCIIIVADLPYMPPPDDMSELSSRRIFERGFDNMGLTSLSLKNKSGIRQTFLQSRDIFAEYVVSQHAREGACVLSAAFNMGELFERHPGLLYRLSRNAAGKIPTYAIWGTAHTHSLSEAFESKGFAVREKSLDKDHIRYIPRRDSQWGREFLKLVVADLLSELLIVNPGGDYDIETAVQYTNRLDNQNRQELVSAYIRAFQLYRSVDKLFASSNDKISDEQFMMQLGSAIVNIQRMLTDLGIDAKSYIEEPFDNSYVYSIDT